jgi:hypothetical protein
MGPIAHTKGWGLDLARRGSFILGAGGLCRCLGPQRVPRAEAHLKKFGGSNLETDAAPLAIRAANHVLAARAQGIPWHSLS